MRQLVVLQQRSKAGDNIHTTPKTLRTAHAKGVSPTPGLIMRNFLAPCMMPAGTFGYAADASPWRKKCRRTRPRPSRECAYQIGQGGAGMLRPSNGILEGGGVGGGGGGKKKKILNAVQPKKVGGG